MADHVLIHSLLSKIKEASVEVKSLEKKIEELNESLTTSEQNRMNLIASAVEKDETITQLNETNEDVCRQLSTLHGEHSRLQCATNIIQRNECMNLLWDIEEKNEALGRSEMQVDSLQSMVQNLEKHIRDQEVQYQEARSKIVDLEIELLSYKSKIFKPVAGSQSCGCGKRHSENQV